jgi:hypothetical protein
MKFTGTLIEDLMATVERAENRAEDRVQPSGAMSAGASMPGGIPGRTAGGESWLEAAIVEPWFASAQENADYDCNVQGVA